MTEITGLVIPFLFAFDFNLRHWEQSTCLVSVHDELPSWKSLRNLSSVSADSSVVGVIPVNQPVATVCYVLQPGD